MIRFIYDGTFEGLLTAVYEAIKKAGGRATGEVIEDIVSEAKHRQKEAPGLFINLKRVVTDRVLAKKVLKSLSSLISTRAIRNLFYCFLSEEEGVEVNILEYIRLVYETNGKSEGNLADETVFKIERTGTRVARELLRFYGLVRFRKLSDEIYYASVEPDYNILPLLAPHFAARFADQKWFIHDCRRNTGIYYNGEKCIFVRRVETKEDLLTSLTDGNPAFFGTDEALYQSLWNDYYRYAAISERTNLRLRNQHMPKKYWKYLVEKVD